jgi:hypothetical protein
MMSHESWASVRGQRVCAADQSSCAAITARNLIERRDRGAGARVWGVSATSSALPRRRAARAGAASRPGGKGRLYGQGPRECAGPGAQARAGRRAEFERCRESGADHLLAAGIRRAWPRRGAVRGGSQPGVRRRGARLRIPPSRPPLCSQTNDDQAPGYVGRSPRRPRQHGHLAPHRPRTTGLCDEDIIRDDHAHTFASVPSASSRRDIAPVPRAAVGRGGAASPHRARAVRAWSTR